MKDEEKLIGIGMTRITYEIMTDSKGQKWCVPTTIDGESCEYLRKYDPNATSGTFERITVHDDL